MSQRSSRIPGLYRLGVAERRRCIAERRGLPESAFAALDGGGLDLAGADGLIENVIGTYALPLGIAPNFRVNGIDYLVPMAVEEPSVVAAAANAARMVRAAGGFSAEVSAPVMTAQIQLTELTAPDVAVADIAARRVALIAQARGLVPRLVARGGGPLDLDSRVVSGPGEPDGGMVVVHVYIDCRDAMGANQVNTVAEGLAPALAELTGGKVGLRILTNLTDRRTVRVSARLPAADLGGAGGGDGDAVRAAIVAASRFAELDPYRAATHNKGIMNGVDAVLVATANDWRGVEAGAHAFAARSGRYAPLAVWRSEGEALVGELELPMAVATAGGAVQAHAGAAFALRLLAVGSAAELAAVVAAAGLASNLAALRALGTEGIQRGHLALHARLVAQGAGAAGDLVNRVAQELTALGEINPGRAREILERLRRGAPRATLKSRD